MDQRRRVVSLVAFLFALVVANAAWSVISAVHGVHRSLLSELGPVFAKVQEAKHDGNNSTKEDDIIPQFPTTNTATTVSPKNPSIAMFYNVFVPNSDNSTKDTYGGAFERSFDIVEEQLSQFAASDAARLSNNNLTVYYNTIGYAKSSQRIQGLCEATQNVTCRHLQHYDVGFEEVTLQKLYDYCRDPQHVDDTVVYLHNKGSYHNNRDEWRRHGTAAATHRDCVQPPDAACNFCAIHVSYIPSVQQHGNMWAAKCSYVHQLMPPQQFAATMERVHQQYKALRKRPARFHHDSWGAWGPWAFALERHANEHWIGSHPAVVPCDLSPFTFETFFKKNYQSEMETNLYQWAMLPRRAIQDRDGKVIGQENIQRFDKVLLDAEKRRREYFFLPGLLLRWLLVYGTVPADDTTWSVYGNFPDFNFWKRATTAHGTRVLDVVFNLTTPLSRIDLKTVELAVTQT